MLDTRLSACIEYEYWLRLGQAGCRFAYLDRKLGASRRYPDAGVSEQRDWVSHARLLVAKEATVHAELARVNREVARVNRELGRVNRELAAERSAAAAAAAAHAAELHAMKASTSWRITRPLRRAADWLRKS